VFGSKISLRLARRAITIREAEFSHFGKIITVMRKPLETVVIWLELLLLRPTMLRRSTYTFARVLLYRRAPSIAKAVQALVCAGAASSCALYVLKVNSVALCKAKQLPEEAALADYEARCKSLHTVSQVFDAFATVERNGEAFLTRGGFLQALLCRTYTCIEPRELRRRCARYAHALLGTGPQHLISRAEFGLLVALLSVPPAHLRVAFAAADADSRSVPCDSTCYLDS
jgi:hypothetical protein